MKGSAQGVLFSPPDAAFFFRRSRFFFFLWFNIDLRNREEGTADTSNAVITSPIDRQSSGHAVFSSLKRSILLFA